MTIGAIILAAGNSCIANEFKPMMEVAGTSMIKREISTLREVGISPIVVITGYNGEELEKHLVHRKVKFIRNYNYENSEMLDSIKLGLLAVEGLCSKVFLIPSDLPMFKAETLKSISESKGDIVVPSYKGASGHPILIDMNISKDIETYQGDCGLRGFFSENISRIVDVDLNDPGVLIEANTWNDYNDILGYSDERLKAKPIKVKVDVSLHREKMFFDSGITGFLNKINETGSMNAACKAMKIAYSRGWTMVNTVENQLGFPIIERQTGGAKGGSSKLTDKGIKYMEKYVELKEKIEEEAEKLFKDFFR